MSTRCYLSVLLGWSMTLAGCSGPDQFALAKDDPASPSAPEATFSPAALHRPDATSARTRSLLEQMDARNRAEQKASQGSATDAGAMPGMEARSSPSGGTPAGTPAGP